MELCTLPLLLKFVLSNIVEFKTKNFKHWDCSILYLKYSGDISTLDSNTSCYLYNQIYLTLPTVKSTDQTIRCGKTSLTSEDIFDIYDSLLAKPEYYITHYRCSDPYYPIKRSLINKFEKLRFNDTSLKFNTLNEILRYALSYIQYNQDNNSTFNNNCTIVLYGKSTQSIFKIDYLYIVMVGKKRLSDGYYFTLIQFPKNEVLFDVSLNRENIKKYKCTNCALSFCDELDDCFNGNKLTSYEISNGVSKSENRWQCTIL